MLPVNGNLLPTVSKFFDDDWNNLFDWTSRTTPKNVTTLPPVNIYEGPDQFIVEMMVPGMNKKDFDISIHNSTLTISSHMKKEGLNDNMKFSLKEFNIKPFRRTFNLNSDVVNDSGITATYKDGILQIMLPKRDEAKEQPARVIKIS